ncbi:MAG: carbohydrate ABC transporter permease [Clostridia bacterium]|nr:carbohydrate ABC transporter permease [Clostridia bacterium]
MIRKSRGDKVFDAANGIFMVLFSITILYPFVYLFSMSVTTSPATISPFSLLPKPGTFTLDNYKQVLSSNFVLVGYKNTILRVVIATVLVLLVSVVTAYPLSKRNLPHRNVITGFIVFTMFFGGGIIPMYVLMRSMKLLNTIWSLILPGLIPTYSMLLIRNYFMSIPNDLDESAKIDGANDYRILFQIILPISTPILATVVLWTLVGHWNAWYDASIYITKGERQVLQAILRQIVVMGKLEELGGDANMAVTPDAVKSTTIVVATVPVLCVYPFVQKYFVKGIMVGSLKG